MNRNVLNKYESNKLSIVCNKDNIKVVKYIGKKIDLIKYNNFVFKVNLAGSPYLFIV